MDINNIQKQAHEMKNREDLLVLLNALKKEEMEEQGLAEVYHPFEMRQLLRYCNPNTNIIRYKQFQIKKKTGGFRQISAPQNRTYKLLLHYVDVIFRAIYSPSSFAMGFADGKSVATNANVHVGQNYVFNLDLKDFFPSIEQPRIWKRLQLKPFNFPVEVANVIAGLCSMKEIREDENGEKREYFILPQGAPTSPSITNMICDKLDRRLAGVAKKYNLRYTRYADDITFSSMHNVYQENSEVRKEIKRIIEDQRFIINDKKTRLQKLGSRQEVTGVIVSSKINVTQKYVRDIRNLLYLWDRYGFVVAERNFILKYMEDKGHVKKGTPNMINVINGKLLYLKMIKGDKDSVYVRLRNKFVVLMDKFYNMDVGGKSQTKYIETTPILDFEKKNKTEIVVCHIESKDLDLTEVSPFKTSSKPKNRYAYFIFDGEKKQLCSINRNVPEADESVKEKLAISRCIGKDGKYFWLIHKIDKVIASLNNAVNIDELNNELDSLLNYDNG